jgi:hypothetical protein
LEIIFSTKRYNRIITKRPRIETNEGPPHKNVTITADVVARPDSTYPIVIKPYKLDISQFGQKVRDEMKFTIDNVSDQNLEITLVAAPTELATIELPKEVEAGKSASGLLKLTKKGIDEDFEKSFTIQLNDEKHSRFTVPIKRNIKNPMGHPSASAGDKGTGSE